MLPFVLEVKMEIVSYLYDVRLLENEIIVEVRFNHIGVDPLPECYVRIPLPNNRAISLDELENLALDRARKFLRSCLLVLRDGDHKARFR